MMVQVINIIIVLIVFLQLIILVVVTSILFTVDLLKRWFFSILLFRKQLCQWDKSLLKPKVYNFIHILVCHHEFCMVHLFDWVLCWQHDYIMHFSLKLDKICVLVHRRSMDSVRSLENITLRLYV